ncbi:FHA domain-containing protein [bacterium]|nr:FHA domain-containing protein [bacterium]
MEVLGHRHPRRRLPQAGDHRVRAQVPRRGRRAAAAGRVRPLGGRRMSRRPARSPLALLVAAMIASTAAAQPSWLHAEPGFPTGDDQLLVPMLGLDASRGVVALEADDLRVAVGESAATVSRLEPTVPVAVMVISDRALARGAWSDAASPLGATGWLAVRSADPRDAAGRPLSPVTAAAAATDLTTPEDPRLWDAVLRGLERLATADGVPTRRVVLVIGDLRDDTASDHPVATCIEVARELAIPVYGVAMPAAATAARERLTRLATASGGMVLEADAPDAALAAGLARIASARGLVLDGPRGDGPVAVTIATSSGSDQVQVAVKARPRGRWTPGPGLVAAVVVVLLAVGGVLGWRQWRGRPVGYLAAGEQDSWRRAIPAAGLTIGRADDNALVLAETRVSKHHALVRWHRGQVQLLDLRSTNGTQVNGRPIRSAALDEGDVIVFGDAVSLVFRRGRSRPQDRG